MTINLSLPITHELKPKITVVGVGGAGGNAVNNMITSHLEGVEFVSLQHGRAVAGGLPDRPQGPARQHHHPRPRRRRPARGRPGLGRGGAGRDPRPALRQPHGVHHRRHGRRYRHGCGAGDRAGGARAGHPYRGGGDQAVSVRGRAPDAPGRGRPHRAAAVCRHADRHPEPEPVPAGQRADHVRRCVPDGRPGAAHGRARGHRPDGDARPDQSRLRRHPHRHERDGQGDDGDGRGRGREAGDRRRRGRDLQPAARRRVDARRARAC